MATSPRSKRARQAAATPTEPAGEVTRLSEDWTADFLDKAGETGDGADRKFVMSLARGLAVLRAFENAGGGLGNQDLVEATGLPKATVTRLTYTLTRLGYLTHSERTSKYQLGPAALSLGHMASVAMRLRSVVRPLLQEFADHVGLSVGLGTRNGLDMVLIESCHGRDTITLRMDIGGRIPLATTSMGRAFLAGLPAPERDYLMGRLAIRYGPLWPGLEKEIRRSLDDFRNHGFCRSMGEWLRDVSGVGVPLPLREGLYAVNCGGPIFRADRERLVRQVGPELSVLARNIRQALGE